MAADSTKSASARIAALLGAAQVDAHIKAEVMGTNIAGTGIKGTVATMVYQTIRELRAMGIASSTGPAI